MFWTPEFMEVVCLAAMDRTDIIFLVVVVLIAVLGPVVARRKRLQAPGLQDVRRMEDELRGKRMTEEALVKLVETSREISAQIDTKIRVLNKLVKDADDRSRRLEQILGLMVPAPDGSTRPETVLTESSASTPAGGEEAGEVASPADRKDRTESGRWVSDLHRRIMALHEEGRSPSDIAREMRLSVQEVNLVLHMVSGADRA